MSINRHALIDQQMWCFGCDVRRAEGNLLIAYGAIKRPAPDQRYHSAYTFWLDDHAALNLWGWGIWIAVEGVGSAYICRARCRVRAGEPAELLPQAWRAQDLPTLAKSSAPDDAIHALTARAFAWIAGYERWIVAHTEPDYRPRVIAAYPQRRRYRGGIPADQMATAWESLAAS